MRSMWAAIKYHKLRKLQEQFADPEIRRVKLNIRFHRDKDQIWAEVVGAPGLATQGRTAREIMNNMSEAISLYFDIDFEYPDDEYVAHVQERISAISDREPLMKRIVSHFRPRHIEMNVPSL